MFLQYFSIFFRLRVELLIKKYYNKNGVVIRKELRILTIVTFTRKN